MMNRIYYKIDFSSIKSYDEIHTIIAKGLMLPDFYGANLDALFDCLTDMLSQKSIIEIYGLENLAEWNNYDKKLIDVFLSAKHALGSNYSNNLSVFLINNNGIRKTLKDTLDTYSCKIDFSKVQCERDIHNVISKALGFSEYRNGDFDALWECLLHSLYTRITKIEILGIWHLEIFGKYIEQIIGIFKKAKYAYNGSFADRFYVTVVEKNGNKTEL